MIRYYPRQGEPRATLSMHPFLELTHRRPVISHDESRFIESRFVEQRFSIDRLVRFFSCERSRS